MLLLSCVPPFFQPVAAVDVTAATWTTGTSGNWSDAARWSPESAFPNGSGFTASILVPTDASLPAGSAYTVTLDDNFAVDAFTHGSSGANLTASLRTFTVNGPTSFDGRQITLGASVYASNGVFTHASGILDLSSSILSGTGTYLKQGGTTKLAGSGLLLPTTQTDGSVTMSGACTLGGGITNTAGSLILENGAMLALANGDMQNSGTIDLLGGNLATLIESATGRRLVNAATGVFTVKAAGSGSRTLAVGVENHGALVLERLATLNAPAGAHSNAGTITAAGQLLMQDALSFANTGTVTSTGGNLSFTGNAATGSAFSNSGTLTAQNGLLLQLFKTASNSGTMNLKQGAATIRTVISGDVHPFDNAGTIAVEPAASLLFNSSGSGTGSVILRDGATLGGGGSISFTNQTVDIQGAWSPGASPLVASTSALGGAGSLTLASGSTLQSTRSQFGLPTTNRGAATFNSSNNIGGGFTNETGGTVTLAGGASLLVHNADFVNSGSFIYAAGTGTTRLALLEGASSGVFRNEANGTVSVEGTGNRLLSTHSVNSGTIALNAAFLLDLYGSTHVNAGTITAGGELLVQGARSFANSGTVTSTGGNLGFTGDANAASAFTNSGSITAKNGFLLQSFKTNSNTGTITIEQGTANIRTATNSNTRPFDHSGIITVAPGASLAFDFSGSGIGVLTLRNGATLGGGGAISFINQAVDLQGPWSNGSSPVLASNTTFAGAGSLAVGAGSTLGAATSHFNLPVTNHGAVTFTASSNTAHGGFTTEAGGSATLDGGCTLRLHDADFTNRGQLRFGPAENTILISRFSTSNSLGVFRNETGGTFTVDGAGFRRILPNTVNQGAMVLNGSLTLDRSAGIHANAGTITVGGGLLVQGARSFANSGAVTSTGGQLVYSGDANIASSFANNGTITATNGLLLEKFKTNSNTGTITIEQGTATIRTVFNSALHPFDHSGTVTVAPGASLAFGFSGTGIGVVTLRDGATLGGGGSLSFTNQAVDLQGPWLNGSSPVLASNTTFAGAGSIAFGAESTLGATSSHFSVPVTNHGAVTFTASSNTAHGGFTTEAGGSATLDAGCSLRLHDADFTNRGQLRFGPGEGSILISRLSTTDSLGVFRNETGGTFTVDGTGSRRVLPNTVNQGAMVLNGTLTLDRSAGIHANSGPITVGGGLLVQGARSFANSGAITSTGGSLSFSGDGNAASAFTNSGSITAKNGFMLQSFKTNSNTGTITIDQGAATIRTVINGSLHPFDHSGTITVAPGASLAFDFSGSGTGVLTLRDGATLGGGGALSFTNQAVELQGPWSNASSPVLMSNTTFAGVGSIAFGAESTLGATNCHFSVPVTNHGAVTFTDSSNTAHGGFTTEAGGSATLDAGCSLRLHDADFTNRGQLWFGPGEGSILISRFNPSDSLGVFRNETGGTFTVDGTGSRGILPDTVNQGAMVLNGSLTLDRSAGIHANSGTILVAGGLLVQNARSFANSGAVTSTGGPLVFSGDADSASSFVNGGTITATNGLLLEKFKSAFNTGTIAVNQGAATVITSFDGVDHPFSNAGTLRIAGGATLDIGTSGGGSGQVSNEAVGRITGSGTLAFPSDNIFNHGTIAPGDSIGTLTVSSMFNTAEAVHEIEVGAHSSDQLDVNGPVHINGTLRVLSAPDYLPAPTNGSVIMRSSGPMFGQFAAIEQPISANGVFRAEVDPVSREVFLSFARTGTLSFEDFQNTYFTPEQIAAGSAAHDHDFDGDSLSNFLEWIHGLDPTTPGWPVPPVQVVRENGQTRLVVLQSTLLPPNVTMEVLTSANLADGFTAIPAEQVVKLSQETVPRYPNAAQVKFGFTDPVWSLGSKRFFKLRFTAP